MKTTLFMLVIAVYIFTSPPALMTGDAGEFMTSACVLGISHPPGFPLYCLLGRITSMLPISNLAWRVTFGSMLFSALASVLLFILLERLTKKTFIPFLASIAYSFSSTVWSQALVAKVYPLNAFLILLSFLVLSAWQEKEDARYLYLFGLVYGISLSNHYPLVLIASPSYLLMIAQNYKKLKTKDVLLSLVFTALALCLYAYLPIRASINPPNNWGDPNNLKRFFNHVMRNQYQLLELGRKVNFSDKINFIKEYISDIWRQFGFFVLPALLGVWAQFNRNRKVCLPFILLFFTNGFLLTYILHFSFTPERLSIVRPYYIPSYIAFALFIGAGLDYVHDLIQDKAARAVATMFILVCFVMELSYSCQRNFNRYDFFNYDYGNNIMSFLKKDSTLFILNASDESLFSTLFLQKVMKKRPDLKIVDCWGNVFENIYGDDFSVISDKNEWMERRGRVETDIIKSTNNPVYYISFKTDDVPQGVKLNRCGIVYLVEKEKNGFCNNNLWALYNYRGLCVGKFSDYQEREIAGFYYYSAGLNAVSMGINSAVPYFEKAALTSADVDWIINDIGLAYFRNGLYDRAGSVFNSLLKRYPEDNTCWYNLGLVYESAGQIDKSKLCFSKAISIDPQDFDSYKELADVFYSAGNLEEANKILIGPLKDSKKYANIYYLAGFKFYVKKDLKKAVNEWEKAVIIDPNYSSAIYNLGLAYRDLREYGKARECLKRYVELEPNSGLSNQVSAVLRSISD